MTALEIREKFNRGELLKTVLLALGTTLVIGGAFVMPNLLLALRPFMKKQKIGLDSLRKTYRALVRKRYVTLEQYKDRCVLRVTEAGRVLQKEYQIKELAKDLKISIPRHWDGHWRIIVFDIPESQKEARTALREMLHNLGCYRFQDSVFIHPFPCENEIDVLRELFEVKNDVYCFVISEKRVPQRVVFFFAKLLSTFNSQN